MKTIPLLTILIGLLFSTGIDQSQDLKESLTFYASFDEKAEADFAKGDPWIFTAEHYDQLPQGKRGLQSEYIQRVSDQGVSGACLDFTRKNEHVLFFKAADNINYTKEDWSGAVSFWLQLEPNQDLEPGYSDPIQITDEGYDDASLWVDFSDKNPRDFRMGVFGDAAVWNPQGGEGGEHPEFMSRLVTAQTMPFGREEWTHVVICFSHLNTAKGSASLFLNGKLQGSQENITEPFSWDLDKATIRLGINYVGLMDELAIFNRALSEEEIGTIYQMKGSLKSML
ncbi:hypothetical protein OKW21_003677 [Catalinimonas alkaloidigena]|uniref:LamG-like jellyroll fold domain-containing protein n=1 Tax=Catalinimonas alkaloidigena TaxID=1075417 RepID=UPI0024066555|nr:LamG-like jellyroll fold domain-containing protein [Catalinimonas alkaloidigena]MDF9798414.1 hypothetical protein [Catalinimonas alkaloidigena]